MAGEQTSANEAAMRKQIRAEIEKKMRVRGGLTWHIAVFVVINALLFLINQMFSPGVQWFVFPLIGWSIGLFFHAFAVLRSGQSEGRIAAEVERELARRSGRAL